MLPKTPDAAASDDNLVIHYLKQLAGIRDGLLISASLLYICGYAVWSVYAFKLHLGLLPAIQAQYFIAGIPPMLLLVLGFFIFQSSFYFIKNLSLRNVLTFNEQRFGSILNSSGGASPSSPPPPLEPATPNDPASSTGVKDLSDDAFGAYIATILGSVVFVIGSFFWKNHVSGIWKWIAGGVFYLYLLVCVGFILSLFYGLAVSLSFVNDTEEAEKQGLKILFSTQQLKKWMRVALLCVIVIAVSIFSSVLLLTYIRWYPRLPQEFGGVSPRSAYIELQSSNLSSTSLSILAPPLPISPVNVSSSNEKKDAEPPVVRTYKVRVFYVSPDYILVKPVKPVSNSDVNIFEIKKDAIKAILWCN